MPGVLQWFSSTKQCNDQTLMQDCFPKGVTFVPCSTCWDFDITLELWTGFRPGHAADTEQRYIHTMPMSSYLWNKSSSRLMFLVNFVANVIWESKFIPVSVLWLDSTSWLMFSIFFKLPTPTALFRINGQKNAVCPGKTLGRRGGKAHLQWGNLLSLYRRSQWWACSLQRKPWSFLFPWAGQVL